MDDELETAAYEQALHRRKKVFGMVELLVGLGAVAVCVFLYLRMEEVGLAQQGKRGWAFLIIGGIAAVSFLLDGLRKVFSSPQKIDS